MCTDFLGPPEKSRYSSYILFNKYFSTPMLGQTMGGGYGATRMSIYMHYGSRYSMNCIYFTLLTHSSLRTQVDACGCTVDTPIYLPIHFSLHLYPSIQSYIHIVSIHSPFQTCQLIHTFMNLSTQPFTHSHIYPTSNLSPIHPSNRLHFMHLSIHSPIHQST